MSLRTIILLSVLSFLLVVVAINGWHLARLTDNIDQKLGEASFQVSKDTVESMLSQRLSSSVLLVNSRFGPKSDSHSESGSHSESDSYSESGSGATALIPSTGDVKRRVVVRSEQVTLEQSVDLQLSDSGESRAIVLERGGHRYHIPIPRTELEQTMVQARDAIIVSSLLIIVLSIVFFFWVSDRITRPLKKVSNTSALIGEGEFGVTIDHASRFTGSELKHLIGSINKMSAHLQSLEIQKNRLKDQQTTNEISEITRGLAHSIRNPLHTILLSLELRPDSDEKYILMQENIKQQIHRIDQHIKSLMVITTHEALTPEPINLHQLLQTIMQEQASEYCQLRVVANVEKQLTDNRALAAHDRVDNETRQSALSEYEQQTSDWNIQGVYSELHAVLATLINNAVEAIDVASFEQQPQSEAPVMIYLSRSDNAVYQIAVADKGKGMSEQQRAQLFKPHNTNKTHGSGMGLYIAQRIISGRYGGDIQYQQNQPEGSVFVVTLSNRELNGEQNKNNIKSTEQSI